MAIAYVALNFHKYHFVLGCNVMIASRSTDKLEKAAKEIRKYVKNVSQLEVLKCNIRNEKEVDL